MERTCDPEWDGHDCGSGLSEKGCQPLGVNETGRVALTNLLNGVLAYQNHVPQVHPSLLKVFFVGVSLLGASPSEPSFPSVPVDRPPVWVRRHSCWCR